MLVYLFQSHLWLLEKKVDIFQFKPAKSLKRLTVKSHEGKICDFLLPVGSMEADSLWLNFPRGQAHNRESNHTRWDSKL